MSSVAEFTIPSEVLPFGDTLAANDDIWIEVERIVPTQDTALPFFWVWGDKPERFMDAAEKEPHVSDTELLDTTENGALFRAKWSPNSEIIRGIRQMEPTIIESEGTAERWRFEIRAQDRDAFNEFQRIFQEQDIPVNLVRLYDLSEVVKGEQHSLTQQQRETLIRAYREGYFEKPRQITQEELGEQFDISSRAVSDRLQRGVRNLVASTLLPSSKST